LTELDTNIKEYFKNKLVFSKEDVNDFFKFNFPDYNDKLIPWRIYSLVSKNILNPVGRGKYTLVIKPNFNPQIDNYLKKVVKILLNEFGKYDSTFKDISWYCVWCLDWLNEFTNHQLFVKNYIVEIQRLSLSSAFNVLKKAGIKNIYLNPDLNILITYSMYNDKFISLKSFLSRSPITGSQNVKIPALEKILVDIFCDKEIFYSVQGNELKEIYRNAVKKYNINYDKLLNYAGRRNKKMEIQNFLLNDIKDELFKFIL
jgi:hypothetical protein